MNSGARIAFQSSPELGRDDQFCKFLLRSVIFSGLPQERVCLGPGNSVAEAESEEAGS